MIKKILPAIICLQFLLIGCAASDDPHKGGLMGYWYGTSSGRYEERRQERLKRLEEQQKAKEQLTEQSKRLSTELSLQDQRLVKEQQRVLQLKKDLAELNTKIDTLKITSDEQRRQATYLKEQIEKTRQDMEAQQSAIIELDSQGGSGADPKRLQILQHERDRLADEYRKLNVYYQALSNAIY